MEFILVFGVVYIVGFFLRGMYRTTMTTKCPHCRSQIDKSASVCKQCGRDVPAS